jgi:hypothetical protein
MLSALDTTKHLFVPQNLTPFPKYTIALNIQIQIRERERWPTMPGHNIHPSTLRETIFIRSLQQPYKDC